MICKLVSGISIRKGLLSIILMIFLISCKVEVQKVEFYLEAVDLARVADKPILVVYTTYGLGHDEFNAEFLNSSKISKIINANFVLVEMIVDDRREIPIEYKNEMLDKFDIRSNELKIRNMGNLNLAIQIAKYNRNAQPLYVILDKEENEIIEPFGYQSDKMKFYKKLKSALEKLNKTM